MNLLGTAQLEVFVQIIDVVRIKVYSFGTDKTKMAFALS